MKFNQNLLTLKRIYFTIQRKYFIFLLIKLYKDNKVILKEYDLNKIILFLLNFAQNKKIINK